MTKKSDDSLNSWSDRAETDVIDSLDIRDVESISPYDDDIDRFFGSISDATDKVSEMTKKVVGSTLELSNNLPWWHMRDFTEDREKAESRDDVDQYFNRPYETRRSIFDAGVPRFDVFRSPFDIFSRFEESSGVTPFGLFAHQGPSAQQYNTCVKKNGVSLWDADGLWRCLFPNSQVPPKYLEYKENQLAGQIVTKEDFEERAREVVPDQNEGVDLGPQGRFFRRFEDFLTWKNTKYEDEKKRVEKQREEFRQRLSSTQGSQSGEGDRVVVGTSMKSSTNTEGGETILKEVKTEYFNDGTSLTNSVTKKKVQGADAWETIEEKSEQGASRFGWLWSSK